MSFALTRACPACGVKNRTPAAHLSDEGKCGACKGTVAPLDAPLDVQSVADFDAIIAAAKVPVLVDFWAAWCGPCRTAGPHVGALAHDMAGRALVLKVNTEALPQLGARYDVQAIPNFIVFSSGKVANQQAGFAGRGSLQTMVADAM